MQLHGRRNSAYLTNSAPLRNSAHLIQTHWIAAKAAESLHASPAPPLRRLGKWNPSLNCYSYNLNLIKTIYFRWKFRNSWININPHIIVVRGAVPLHKLHLRPRINHHVAPGFASPHKLTKIPLRINLLAVVAPGPVPSHTLQAKTPLRINQIVAVPPGLVPSHKLHTKIPLKKPLLNAQQRLTRDQNLIPRLLLRQHLAKKMSWNRLNKAYNCIVNPIKIL